MGPKLKFRGSVPPEARRVIEEYYVKYELGEPESFSGKTFFYLLARPYEAGVSDYEVTRESLSSFRVSHSQNGVRWIILEDGKWKFDTRILMY